MEQASKLIESIATLLWPLMALLVVCLFRPAVAAIVESAKSRKFTLKIGGQELTMEEANEQQQALIADLQAKLVELSKKVGGAESPSDSNDLVRSLGTSAPMVVPDSNVILWVDDVPKSNSYFIEQMTSAGLTVDLALSTAQGLSKFDKRKYRYIISNMMRTESGVYNVHAGLDLLRAIRQRDTQTPFIIFCTGKGAQQYKDQAMDEGATAIIASPTDLFGLLNLGKAKERAS